MSSLSCNSVINSDLGAGTWNLTGLRVGFTFAAQPLYFKNADGTETNITGDDFVMNIYDAADALVDTLTVGGGIVIVANNRLDIVIGAPVTDTAGKYTHDLIWTRPLTSWDAPVLSGQIIVKA